MPYNLHIVKSKDFMKLDAHGKLDLKGSRDLLATMAKACLKSGLDHALLDVRDMYGNLSITDLFSLASTFSETGFPPDSRLALLHRFDGGEKADFFAMCANNRGWNVQSFDSFEEAFEWLSKP